MEKEQKFKIGNKVKYKGKEYEIVKAAFTYFPDGAFWMYTLGNGILAQEKDLTLTTTPPKGDDVDSGAKNREKRGKYFK